MNIPGFSAEDSLYKSDHRYLGTAVEAHPSNQVVPQFSPVGLCNKANYYCNMGYENWCKILDKFCLKDF